ncbi:MAG: hypothetical protein HPY76_01860 [Anaerolineae bacterium]|nr:hypothetical protein [Anaerolineae bacterium]
MNHTDVSLDVKTPHHHLTALLFALIALEGILPLLTIFDERSMARNALLWGYSAPRLAVGTALLLAMLGFTALALLMLAKPSLRARLHRWVDAHIVQRDRLTAFSLLLLFIPACLLLFAAFTITPLGTDLGMLLVVFRRMQFAWLWLGLICLQTLGWLWWNFRPHFARGQFWSQPAARNATRALLGATLLAALLLLALVLVFELEHLLFLPVMMLLAALIGFARAELGWRKPDPEGQSFLLVLLNAALVFCFVFIAYRFSSLVVSQPNTPAKSYFDALADAWLHGKLYLVNPPQTHDLTLYRGEWYVANPPLAAVLMLPWIALFGLEAMNTVVFSILFGAANAALVYLLLARLAARRWISLDTGGALWLTALFAFGTAQWYIGIGGVMWFISQTITITCLALAALLALEDRRPIWSGAVLALAMLARPHILVAFPLLLGLHIQHRRERGERFDLRAFIKWGMAMAIPVALAGGTMLFYNWLRFDNPLDYGYLTENVADFMAGDLKQYGTFHPVFIERNLRLMLLGLPKWSEYCQSYLPSVQGLSIFLVTPALVWLVGSFRRTPWVVGCWAGVFSTLVPLMLYYNTGAWQFGYKYLLDFIIPVIMLLAVATGKRVRVPLALLILASIVINGYGVLWWAGLVCRG